MDDDDNDDMPRWSKEPIDLPEDVKGLYFALRKLDDQRIIGIHRLLYHWTLHVDVHETGYEERYCYPTLAGAIEGFLNWRGKGDPPGPWVRHPRAAAGAIPRPAPSGATAKWSR